MAGDLQPGDVGYGHNQENHQAYKKLYKEVNGGSSQLGDKGFGAQEFLEAYKQVYNSGKCLCKSGYCRPTDIRLTQLDSVTGYDALIDREWHPVPMEAMQNESTLSPELMKVLFRGGVMAHVCAYPDVNSPGGQRIECLIMKILG